MKLSATIDLEPLRAAALDEIDQVFCRRFDDQSKMLAVYSLKAQAAEMAIAGETEHPALTIEAEHRGISIEDLARLIIDRNEAFANTLMSMETDRQTLKGKIKGAVDQHAINDAMTIIRGGR